MEEEVVFASCFKSLSMNVLGIKNKLKKIVTSQPCVEQNLSF